MIFLQYPTLEVSCPQPPPPPFLFVCFSGIAQYNLIAVEAFIPVSAVAFHDFKNV